MAAWWLQAGLNEKVRAQGGQVPRKVITAPFVQIPLGVTEDRLVGTVDIEVSMKVWFQLCNAHSLTSIILSPGKILNTWRMLLRLLRDTLHHRLKDRHPAQAIMQAPFPVSSKQDTA